MSGMHLTFAATLLTALAAGQTASDALPGLGGVAPEE